MITRTQLEQSFFPFLDQVRKLYHRYQTQLYPVAALGLFFIGTVFILLGVFFAKSKAVQAKSNESSNSITANNSFFQKDDAEPTSETIMVDVAGAVVKPGLYALKTGDRVAAALEQAGGFDPKVNKNYAAHSLNLSQKLSDEEKIYIPFQNEKINSVEFNTSRTSSKVSSSSQQTSHLIHVNTATQAELETLSGVGAVRAQAIISSRPFSSLKELVSKKVITQKIYEENEEKLSL